MLHSTCPDDRVLAKVQSGRLSAVELAAIEPWGGPGRDELAGEEGNDQLVGGEGDDTLWGSIGTDTLWGSAGNDMLFGEAENDDLVGGEGDDFVGGGDGNDRLWGETGDDQLLGDAGDDQLYAGDQNDELAGGLGSDQLHGGGGDDLYTFEDAGGTAEIDRIVEYAGQGHDTVDYLGVTNVLAIDRAANGQIAQHTNRTIHGDGTALETVLGQVSAVRFAVGLPSSGRGILDPEHVLSNSQYQAVGIVRANGSMGTGTLIASNWVLTAAHVVDGAANNGVRFEVGGAGGESIWSTNVIINPRWFTSSDNHGDIALVRLSRSVANVTPMAIYRGPIAGMTSVPDVGTVITQIGFGNTGNGTTGEIDGTSGTKRLGHARIDNFHSDPWQRGGLVINSDFISYRFERGSSFIGHGDSGGPDIFTVTLDTWIRQERQYVIGVHSYVSDFTYGSMSTSISVAFYASWIDATIAAFATQTNPNPGTERFTPPNGGAPVGARW